MTKKEICREYRQAKNKLEQIQILAELNQTSRWEIIDLLLRGGEKVQVAVRAKKRRGIKEVPDEKYGELAMERLEELEREIAEAEREYRLVVRSLAGR